MLRENIKMETLIKFLDAKARITIWKTSTEKIFDGCVYQLYDAKDYNDMYALDLLVDLLSGISVIVAETHKPFKALNQRICKNMYVLH